MRRVIPSLRSLMLATFAASACVSLAAEGELPRRVFIFFDGSEGVDDPRETDFHRVAEAPLHYLGLATQWWDVNSSLPGERDLARCRGFVLAFKDDRLRQPVRFVRFLLQQHARGRKLVFFGNPGFLEDPAGYPTDPAVLKKLATTIGLTWRWDTRLRDAAFDVSRCDKSMIGYERPYVPKPPSLASTSTGPKNRIHLAVTGRATPVLRVDLVVSGSWGGFVAPGAAFDESYYEYPFWVLDPYRFYRRVLGLTDDPALDVTTVNGSRVFFSHLDGDGLLNVSEVEPKRLSGEIIRDHVLAVYPLPFSVSFVTAHFDPGFVPAANIPRYKNLARTIFALPNVEAGSHTFSHPYDWKKVRAARPGKKKKRYNLPIRGYDRFDVGKEVDQSIALLNTLTPSGKQTRLYLWSGDCLPTEDALGRTERLGLGNMNGGDSRWDSLHGSCSTVSPLYGQVGRRWQCYTGAGNENVYTGLWTGPFWGFSTVTETFERTGAPRRLKPVNLYFHFYIGEKHAALNALKRTLTWCQSRPCCPLYATEYIALVQGFRTGRVWRVAPGRYLVRENGQCRTVRFDACGQAVDMIRSRGVLGWRREGERLYVTLDASDEHVIQLGERARGAYLERANALLRAVALSTAEIRFTARTFLPARVRFGGLVPASVYTMRVDRVEADHVTVDSAGFLAVTFPGELGQEHAVVLSRTEEAE